MKMVRFTCEGALKRKTLRQMLFLLSTFSLSLAVEDLPQSYLRKGLLLAQYNDRFVSKLN